MVLYYENNLNATTFSYHLPKNMGVFDEMILLIMFMTSNVNFDARPILQLFVFALCACSKPLNRKKYKKWFCMQVYIWSHLEN